MTAEPLPCCTSDLLTTLEASDVMNAYVCLLEASYKQMGFPLFEIQHHLAKEAIGPCKPEELSVFRLEKNLGGHTPLPGPDLLVMGTDGLMHQAKPIRRGYQLAQGIYDLSIIISGHNLHNQGHGPSHARSYMRSASAIAGYQHFPFPYGSCVTYEFITGPCIKYGLSWLRTNFLVF